MCIFVGCLAVLRYPVPELATPLIEPGQGQTGIGASILRIKLKGVPEEASCLFVRLVRPAPKQRHPLERQLVGRQGPGGLATGRLQGSFFDAGTEGGADAGNELALQFEEPGRRCFQLLAPKLRAAFAIDQTGNEAETFSLPLETPAQEMRGSQAPGGFPVGQLRNHRTRHRCDAFQRGEASERVRKVLHQAVGDGPVRLPPRNHLEGQNRQHRLLPAYFDPAWRVTSCWAHGAVSWKTRCLPAPRVKTWPGSYASTAYHIQERTIITILILLLLDIHWLRSSL